MGDNFFQSPAQAKKAMRENHFTEVYLSTAVTTPIQLKGWVSQVNPFERHGQRWHLYLSRVEMLRRMAGAPPEECAASSGAVGCGRGREAGRLSDPYELAVTERIAPSRAHERRSGRTRFCTRLAGLLIARRAEARARTSRRQARGARSLACARTS